MKYESYIISYAPGSAGTFLTSMLGAMLRGSDTLNLSDRNNAAGNEGYLGVSITDPNSPDIYHKLFFDDDADFRILKTHVYPNFPLINITFKNIGIILVTLTEEDVFTSLGNNGYKNNKIKEYMDGREIVSRNGKHWKRLANFAPFVNPTIPKLDNVLEIKYAELFAKDGGVFVAQKKIEEFTSLRFTENQNLNWQKYVDNQAIFLEKFMPWLSEVKSEL